MLTSRLLAMARGKVAMSPPQYTPETLVRMNCKRETRTDKRGSHEDDAAAQAGRVDPPRVLRSLQHPDVVQLHAGDVQTPRSEGQARTFRGRQSMPGYSSRSPVWTLKQAPCHGQRTV
ncbi:hypothetical protein EYF80_023334 [Liparis tanakae]|uniref:Uncharacterized protein n=1 Tax=Liparis tanakae TaxID=230148 RepID=A0A4Z2HKV8_9TELE|nr:hypothetical protein EYF80_023334 [Liparis tanakae]